MDSRGTLPPPQPAKVLFCGTFPGSTLYLEDGTLNFQNDANGALTWRWAFIDGYVRIRKDDAGQRAWIIVKDDVQQNYKNYLANLILGAGQESPGLL